MTLNQQNFTNQIEDTLPSYEELGSRGKISDKILIVDDEDIVRRFHLDCLSSRYTCFEADSAEKALKILEKEKISLVITDWVMPGMSGTMLLRRVVRDFPDTLVMMVTGVDHPERAIDAMRSGAFDYLLKPCNPSTLEFTVERALNHRRLGIKARQYRIELEFQNIELIKQKAQLERLQAQIIHAEKMASVGHLTAGIAHEINNPLGYISGNLQILEQYIQDIQRLLDSYEAAGIPVEYLAEIEKVKAAINYNEIMKIVAAIISDCQGGARRVSDLVQNLRVFSKLDQPKFTATDINRDIDSVIKLIKRFFDQKNIELVLNYEQIPEIQAFAAHLNQVWMNLLLNAVQSINQTGGVVTVSTAVTDEFITIKISDTGEGIAPENLSRVFEPFFTTKSIGQGTGLGLSIAHSIVGEHNGSITVESNVNRGTVLTVKLPNSSGANVNLSK